MSDIIERIKQEWGVISAAPWSAAIIATVTGGCIWFFVNQINAGTLSAKDATIETLKTENQSYKDKLNGASPDEARAQINDLENRLAKIEPRRLREDERRAIARFVVIPAAGKQFLISIESDMSCPDCAQYAADFLAITDNAHWSSIAPKVMGVTRASPKGIAILTPDPGSPLPEAEAFVRGLTEAKIPFDLKAGSDRVGLSGPQIPAILITPRSSF